MKERIKILLEKNQKDVILFTGITLISLSSFALGRLTAPGLAKAPIQFREIDARAQFFATSTRGVGESSNINNDNQLVGSKSGSYYYYTWCSGANRIKEQNKVLFSSPKEAQAAGYRLASNCQAPN